MKDNFTYTFTQFLSLLKVKVTRTSAVNYLENHPDTGSLLAYSETLSYFNIENAGLKISHENLKNVPPPFVTFYYRNGGTFSLVKSVTDEKVEWLDTQHRWVKTSWQDFLKDWSQIVLLAETNASSGEKNYEHKRKKEFLKNVRLPLVISLLLVLFFSLIIPVIQLSLTLNILVFLKLSGMTLTSLLFVKSINNSSDFINRLCSAGPKVNCQSILDSPAAMITPWLSWSDTGFIYFFGTFFSLLLSSGSAILINNFLLIQAVLSSMNIAFGLYSIYYQAIKSKMWCTLCLGVVIVFASEFLLSVLFSPFHSGTNLRWDTLSNLFIGFSIPVIFLLLFKNTYIGALKGEKTKKELIKIKSNPKIFEAFMSNQRKMPEIPENMPVIVLGNPDAPHTLTIISNPLCTPCARMHQRIEKLIQENEYIRCQIIFLSNTSEENEGGKFVRKLFSLPKHLYHQAVEEWFSRNNKNYEFWNRNYSHYILDNDSAQNQNMHNEWANYAEVRSTPTIFINGRLLPQIISIDDLGSHLVHYQHEPVNS